LIRVKAETYERLSSIKDRLTSMSGKPVTFDEVIANLISLCWQHESSREVELLNVVFNTYTVSQPIMRVQVSSSNPQHTS
jgi:hypothetical protein